jgi:predicted nuclease of predicted toxin-antitoxin system
MEISVMISCTNCDNQDNITLIKARDNEFILATSVNEGNKFLATQNCPDVLYIKCKQCSHTERLNM